jgi:Protein of unknown function (DUF2971)
MAAERPDILYHYTTQEGFLGIIQSRTLWASSIRQLNDASEFNYAVDLALKISKAYTNSGKDTSAFEEIVGVFRHLLNIYVCSFSTQKDQLSQWRAYSRDGGGFSIGFDTAYLEAFGKTQDFTLENCTYDEHSHEAEMEDLVNWVQNNRKLMVEDILTRLMNIVPRMKHPSFSEEKEWRLANRIIIPAVPVSDICYRSGKSFPVPYRKLQMGDAFGALIREVIVGPTPHSDLSVSTADEFLRHKGIDDVHAEKSRIPYRSW